MANEEYPRATVRVVEGQLLLDDPDAMAVFNAVGKHNCKHTLELHSERVAHFKQRIIDRGSSPDDLVIVLLNMDDPNGRRLGDILMPGNDANWQAMRDQGQVPFARGLAARQGIQELVSGLDKDTGEKLAAMKGKTVVVIMDHGVVETFEA